MLFVRLAVLLLVAAACTDYDIRLSQRDDDFEDHLWVNYLRGDTVQLYAREVTEEGDPTAAASATSPDLYTWTSRTPDVVQVIGRGRLVMKGVGLAELSVRGPHATREFILWSYPPDAQVRFAPRDTTLNVGDIVSITIVVLDGTGKVMQTNEQRQAGYAVSWGINTPHRVLSPVTPAGQQWRAEAPGTVTIMGGISLFNRFNLKDSTNLTVR